jgi:hypothetical protein
VLNVANKKKGEYFMRIRKLFLSLMVCFLSLAGCDNSAEKNQNTASLSSTNVSIEADEKYYVFGGDILLSRTDPGHQQIIKELTGSKDQKITSKGALPNRVQLWSKKRIYYHYAAYFSDIDKDKIERAIHYIESVCDINFINEQHSNKNVYLFVRTNETGFIASSTLGSCDSPVLRFGKKFSYATVLHELCHGLGLTHEHQRLDRNKYIKLNKDNIRSEVFDDNFKMYEPHNSRTFGVYDYDSILHYSAYAAAIDYSIPTIISPEPIGQRITLSSGDILSLKSMYGPATRPIMGVKRSSGRYLFPWKPGKEADNLEVEIYPTEFGPTKAVTHTYEIENLGGSDLVLTGTPIVSMSSSTKFTLDISGTSRVIAPGTSTPIKVTFYTEDIEVNNFANITISNNTEEKEYKFTLRGRGVTKPFMFNEYFHDRNSWDPKWMDTFTVKDMNKDGYADLIWNYTEPSGGIYTHIALANSDLTFRAPRSYRHSQGNWDPRWSDAFTVKDMNKDGFPDLIWNYTDNHFGNETFIALSNGVTSFQSLMHHPHAGGNWDPRWSKTFTVKDMNKDGYPDLVWNYTGAGSGNSTYIALSNGGTSFQPLSHHQHATGNWDERWSDTFTVKDMNKDGYPDLLWNYTDAGYGNVSYIALSNGGTSFQPLNRYHHSSDAWDPRWSKTFTVKDMNKDGYPDLIWNYTDGDYGNVSHIAISRGGTSFQPLNRYHHSSDAWGPSWSKTFTVKDMNKDGYPDLIWNLTQLDYGNGTHIAFSNGGASFKSPKLYQHDNDRWSSIWYKTFRVEDMNNDGLPDFVWNFCSDSIGNKSYVAFTNSINDDFKPVK